MLLFCFVLFVYNSVTHFILQLLNLPSSRRFDCLRRLFIWILFVSVALSCSGERARRISEVEHSLMVRWVVGSILHGVDPLSYWCNKGRGMCYPVCGMVHIKEPLLLIDKSSLCGGSRFPFSLSEWSLTICMMPYNRR